MRLITHIIAALALTLTLSAEDKGAHLFILSGQSNMAGLKSDKLFNPLVEEAFGKDNTIVVREAWSGRPIRVWYNVQKDRETGEAKGAMHLYAKMMDAVKEAVGDRELATVTFIWMQGETDGGEKKGDVYEASLKALIAEIKKDLKLETLNVVVGRICDYDKQHGINPHWAMVRDAQVKVGESAPNHAWVDTDDLNNKPDTEGNARNGLHYTGEGYKILGQRFAEKAIELINKKKGEK